MCIRFKVYFGRRDFSLFRSAPKCCSFSTWFGHDLSAGQFLSVRSLSFATTTWYSGFFLWSFVTRFTSGNLKKIGFEFHLNSLPTAFSGWSVDQPITSLLSQYTVLTPPQKVETAVLGFQFGVYHVIVPLSFLRSVSLASLLQRTLLWLYIL